MSIKILPAQLANQIAAGEVVERPASVLKELLENSIDAGATAIEVDIEKGGHKKIKITDNGAGVSKEQLKLALSRHATSKIHDLDDLEHIVTLGFRGEALASISSVSRLSFTSKPESQNEAWQARCEGRDMQVLVEPAAHPKGTSVEVLDLFFNTPARRKFLRTEKTEFNHIEALFRRFALSQFGVGLKLKHNGKLIKSLPAISARDQYLKRIRQICGPAATEGLLELNSEYQQFRLWGWVSQPGQYQSMNDNQFVFVNNRMMKDKLIFHAIRQAYEGLLPEDKFPYFVLYLEVPTEEVDVNVHPAKHEVRFHQSRLIHDFIFSAINDALGQSFQSESHDYAPQVKEQVSHQYQTTSSSEEVNSLTTKAQQPTQPPEPQDYITPLQPTRDTAVEQAIPTANFSPGSSSFRYQSEHSEPGFKTAVQNYQELVQTHQEVNSTEQKNPVSVEHMTVPGIGLVVKERGTYWLIPKTNLMQWMLRTQFAGKAPVTQPLLLPVSVAVKGQDNVASLVETAKNLGLDLQHRGTKLMLKGVPVGSREQCWQDILVDLVTIDGVDEQEQILRIMAKHWRMGAEEELTALWQKMLQRDNPSAILQTIAQKLPLAAWLESQLS